MDGQDVIGHLMDVEREASSLIKDAHIESDRRKTAANEEASKKFKDAYDTLMAELDAALASGMKAVDLKRESELAAYQSRIEGLPQDRSSFNSFLDSYFSKA